MNKTAKAWAAEAARAHRDTTERAQQVERARRAIVRGKRMAVEAITGRHHPDGSQIIPPRTMTPTIEGLLWELADLFDEAHDELAGRR